MTQCRAWQRMLSGRRLDLLNPSPVDIEMEDIAHGLAFVARWNGQTTGCFPYSVAEHSLLVEEIFRRIAPASPARWRLAALLHDAAEYVIGDMISPVKNAIGPEYPELENRLTEAIYLRFGLPMALPEKIGRSIKRADKYAAWTEATQIAGFSIAESNKIFGRPRKDTVTGFQVAPRSPRKVRDEFTSRANHLIQQMDRLGQT